jgi:V8-like Glu-specific endopeptidase
MTANKLILLSLLISNLSFASVKVIYGEDNRSDVYNSKNTALVKLASSTAAMIKKNKLQQIDLFTVELLSGSLTDTGRCESERFSSQPAAANCSGFLIADNLIATAGHCVQSQADCSNYEWAFDYKVDYETQDKVFLEKENIYGCKRIVSRSLNSATLQDYAVIELDRKVTDREVLKLRTSGKPKAGDEILVIGHPSGLPSKITTDAYVRSVNDIYLVSNLDTYGGNSGSAVFNATTHEVEGILVRGAQDYKWDSSQGCEVSNVIGETAGRGEDVTLIKHILSFL